MFDVKRGPFEGSEWFMINLGLSRGQKVWHRGVRTFDVEFIISKREEARVSRKMVPFSIDSSTEIAVF